VGFFDVVVVQIIPARTVAAKAQARGGRGKAVLFKVLEDVLKERKSTRRRTVKVTSLEEVKSTSKLQIAKPKDGG